MKLQSFRRLLKTDFEQQYQGLIDKLASVLNIDIESVYNVLNKNVSISDNILCTVKDVTVTVDATGTPTQQTQFSLDSQVTKVLGTQVIYAINNTNSTSYPTGGIFISFTPTTTGVLINNITGLVANNSYTLRIIAYG